MADSKKCSELTVLLDALTSKESKVKDVRRWLQKHTHFEDAHSIMSQCVRQSTDLDQKMGFLYVANDWLMKYLRTDKEIDDVQKTSQQKALWTSSVKAIVSSFCQTQELDEKTKTKIIKIIKRWGEKGAMDADMVKSWIASVMQTSSNTPSNTPSKGSSPQLPVMDQEMQEAQRQRRDIVDFQACDFLARIASQLNLKQHVVSTAHMYFHYFYERESFDEYNRFIVVQTCILLASKAEDSPRRLNDITTFATRISKDSKVPYEINFGTEGKKPMTQEVLNAAVVAYELQLLHAVGFDVAVALPQGQINTFLKQIIGHSSDMKAMRMELFKNSFRNAGFALYTDAAVKKTDREMCAAAIFIAGESHSVSAKLGSGWHSKLKLSEEEEKAAEYVTARIRNYMNWRKRFGFVPPTTPARASTPGRRTAPHTAPALSKARSAPGAISSGSSGSSGHHRTTAPHTVSKSGGVGSGRSGTHSSSRPVGGSSAASTKLHTGAGSGGTKRKGFSLAEYKKNKEANTPTGDGAPRKRKAGEAL